MHFARCTNRVSEYKGIGHVSLQQHEIRRKAIRTGVLMMFIIRSAGGRAHSEAVEPTARYRHSRRLEAGVQVWLCDCHVTHARG